MNLLPIILKDLKIKNQCLNLSISKKDLAHLALGGLHLHFIEKLDGYDYYSLNQL